MHNIRVLYGGSCWLGLLLQAATLACLASFSAGQSIVIPVGFLPQHLRCGEAPHVLRKGYQKGLLATDTSRRRVGFYWMAGAIINQPAYRNYLPSLTDANEPFPVAEQLPWVTTRYHPNAICRVGADRVLVAGVTAEAAVVIERWDLNYPSPMPAPVTDSSTGITTVQLAVPGHSPAVLHLDSTATNRFVRAMSEVLVAGSAATQGLVLWDDNGDVATIDLTTGATSLIAGASGGPLGPIPALGSIRYNRIPAAEHVDLGYVYEFYHGTTLHGRSDTWPLLVLLDANKDGTLDGHLVLDRETWVADGWNDETKYVNPWYF